MWDFEVNQYLSSAFQLFPDPIAVAEFVDGPSHLIFSLVPTNAGPALAANISLFTLQEAGGLWLGLLFTEIKSKMYLDFIIMRYEM